ncbi:MAG: response regulator [Bdellovibrionales bacterium]|jgi:two-component system chemotaxis response regulator CheY|nr:response regulator [Bdellovibrionales bacterium]
MFPLNIRVLVVDDMMTMRKLVSRALKEIGFTDIIEAADGAKGYEALVNSDRPVGLIVSDWNMPNTTGVDLLRRVRAEGRFKDTPFILLTAESEASQVTEALKAGVSGYVVKPFTVDGLRAQIMNAHKKLAG